MSDGSGFSGSWERLTGIEATQDEVEEGLFGKGRFMKNEIPSS